jgi:hypothetical protein
VPESLTCYDCDREPTQQCPRCGRPYCDEHGEEFCGICLHPSSGVPSFTLYRGSLLALLVGTALAVWLLIQPTSEGQTAFRPTLVTPTTVLGAGLAPTTTPGPGQTPAAGTTPGAPASTPTPGPASGTTTYRVVSGDTLSAICETRRPARLSFTECIDEIRSLNNLTSDVLSVGQELRIPQ